MWFEFNWISCIILQLGCNVIRLHCFHVQLYKIMSCLWQTVILAKKNNNGRVESHTRTFLLASDIFHAHHHYYFYQAIFNLSKSLSQLVTCCTFAWLETFWLWLKSCMTSVCCILVSIEAETEKLNELVASCDNRILIGLARLPGLDTRLLGVHRIEPEVRPLTILTHQSLTLSWHMIHHMFSLACHWFNRVTWLNMPQLKLGTTWSEWYSPIFKSALAVKNIIIKTIIKTVASIWCEDNAWILFCP